MFSERDVAAEQVQEAVDLALRVVEPAGARPAVGAGEDRARCRAACDPAELGRDRSSGRRPSRPRRTAPYRGAPGHYLGRVIANWPAPPACERVLASAAVRVDANQWERGQGPVNRTTGEADPMHPFQLHRCPSAKACSAASGFFEHRLKSESAPDSRLAWGFPCELGHADRSTQFLDLRGELKRCSPLCHARPESRWRCPQLVGRPQRAHRRCCRRCRARSPYQSRSSDRPAQCLRLDRR